jgi:hypothetical protein
VTSLLRASSTCSSGATWTSSSQGHGKQSAAGVPALHGGWNRSTWRGGRPSGPHDAHYMPLDDAKLDKIQGHTPEAQQAQEGNMLALDLCS